MQQFKSDVRPSIKKKQTNREKRLPCVEDLQDVYIVLQSRHNISNSEMSMQPAMLSLELYPEQRTRKSFILAIHIARSVNIQHEYTYNRTDFPFVSIGPWRGLESRLLTTFLVQQFAQWASETLFFLFPICG